MRTGSILLAGAVALAASACREGVAPFQPDPVEHAGPLVQLTWNVGDERDPQWSADGESIVFHTDLWYGAPALQWTLLAVPAEGGTAVRLAAAAQPTGSVRLLLPAPAPDGERLAYLHLRRVVGPTECLQGTGLCPLAFPRLDTGAVKVRRLDALGSTFEDPAIDVGYTAALEAGDPDDARRVHPFQEDFAVGAEVTNLRTSWDPGGDRLVFSDGTRLLLWSVGAAAATPIPNTAEGVAPAWSPDGAWIAFGLIRRGAERSAFCSCGGSPPAPLLGWQVDARLIAVIRPDGTDLRVLGDGSEPAWSPDGATLYFRRGESGLYRVPAAGGAVTPLPGTDGARAPAVSPDGGALAFARRTGTRNDFNIWRLELEP